MSAANAPVRAPATARLLSVAQEAAAALTLIPGAGYRIPSLEPGWRDSWWRTLGRGARLTVGYGEPGDIRLMAPFFVEHGMAMPAGVDGADRLDLLGSSGDSSAVARVLGLARAEISGFTGFRFYHLPSASPTVAALADAAGALGLVLAAEESYVLPAIDLTDTAWVTRITERTSLRRHRRNLDRLGSVRLERFAGAEEMRSRLDEFFAQHIQRRSQAGDESQFTSPGQRAFFGALAEEPGAAEWLRFSALYVDRTPVAYHFGTHLDGRYMWYKPSFDTAWSRHSPGEVLLRELILAALDEGAHTFDFGLGDEPFKRRFATHFEEVTTYGLYDPAALP